MYALFLGECWLKVFQTDQDRCYDAQGRQMSCRDSGQDAQVKSGVLWPSPRFETYDQIITDLATGCLWAQDAGLSEFPLSWSEAFDFVADLNRESFAGLNGWRLPERSELFSLVSHSRINPAIMEPERFKNIFNGYYWTGTACARLSDQAWNIHVGGGRVVRGMKHQSAMVWPIHDPVGKGARNTEAPRSTDSTKDDPCQGSKLAVLDSKTGLSWMRQADLTGRAVTWQQALAAVRQLNQERPGGFNDWRLPNIRELESLVDLSFHSPAVKTADCFESIQLFYWSSTTSVYEPSYAWTLYARDGYLGVGYKPDAQFHVWPVRR